tara:strand:- start:649 stop:1623 length:975 start_codon:yes stop_codon:yes gene_type:complete
MNKEAKTKSFKLKQIEISEYLYLYNNFSIKNRTITQSPGYLVDNEIPCYLKIYYGDKLICLVTISIKRFLKGIFKIARISNGPLIIDSQENYSKKKLLKSIFVFCRSNNMRIISIAPSLNFTEKDIYRNFFSFKLNRIPWGSIYVDLNKTEEDLEKGLKANWRNKVRKGNRLCKIKNIKDKSQIIKILKEYEKFSNNLNFEPIPFLKCLKWSENYLNKSNLLNLKIYSSFSKDDLEEELGSIGIVNFGQTSFYLFVQTTKLGRKNAANTFMLWRAIIDSKYSGYKIFDLGGYNNTTKKGVKEFKEGIGGKEYNISGEYIHIELF